MSVSQTWSTKTNATYTGNDMYQLPWIHYGTAIVIMLTLGTLDHVVHKQKGFLNKDSEIQSVSQVDDTSFSIFVLANASVKICKTPCMYNEITHIVFMSMHCPKKLYTLGVIAINLGSSTIKGKSKDS